MESAEKILVITTGGTIESFYNPEEGTRSIVKLPNTPEETCIPAALERMGYEGYAHNALLMRDSNEFTDADRETLFHAIINSEQQRIVVVHGTDTLPVHAQALKERIAKLPSDHPAHSKTIVFAGAMGPLRDKNLAWRNQARGWEVLDKAMGNAQHQQAGVWIEVGMGPWAAQDVAKYKETVEKDGVDMVESSGFKWRGSVVKLPSEERGR